MSEARKPYIVNVGLPRTGTKSFHEALQLLGLTSMHIWHKAEHDAKVFNDAKINLGCTRSTLSSFHGFSDTPFYALREPIERFYPWTSVVHTTRNKDSWLRSMIRHKLAGGAFLRDMYGLPQQPYDTSHLELLSNLYDRHHAEVCRDSPAIHLEHMSDRRKWETLCRALPDPGKWLGRVGTMPWPWIE